MKKKVLEKNYSAIQYYLIVISLLMFLPCVFDNTLAQETHKDVATLNFVDTDLQIVVRAVGKFTNRIFIFDPRVKGKLDLVSDKPVTKLEAYKLLAISLKLRGYALMQAEGFTMVIPEADGKKHSSFEESKEQGSGQISTKIFNLEYENASNLIPILRPLITPNNVITPSNTTNSLIITDYQTNLEKLGKIIKKLDTPRKTDDINIIQIKNAIASDLVAVANRILNRPNNGSNIAQSSQVILMADRRTNSIIIRSTSAKGLESARSLIDKLDRPLDSTSNVHVVYLKNANALQLAQVLTSIGTNNSNLSNSGGSASNGDQGLNGGGTSQFGNTFIQADPKTNTLIISSTEENYRNLRSIIDQLDSRRAQVYVESLIVEVSADKAEAFGVQWAGVSGTSTSDFRIGLLAGVSDNLISSAGSAILNLSETTNTSGLTGLAAALENTANANILSMPNLITLDNEEAKIMVGKNVPFVTGQFTSNTSGSANNPFQTIERKDVGLSLQIKPQISEGGIVKMEIYQETSSIQETTTSGLITNKRSLETRVLVNDGDILVLGGLIEDTISDTIQKVPLLGDIPFFGKVFQFQSRSRAKTNLMVFIRPTVLRSASESSALSADRYDYIGASKPDISFDDSLQLPQLPNITPLSEDESSIPSTLDFSRKTNVKPQTVTPP